MQATLSYHKGDITKQSFTKTVVLHGCNDIGVMGGGVALAIRQKWPRAYSEYREWFLGYSTLHLHENTYTSSTKLQLGEIQLVHVDMTNDVYVCNLISQKSIGPNRLGIPPVRIEAICEGLEYLGDYISLFLEDYQIATVKLGCGLGGGYWSIVEPIIYSILIHRYNIPVTVYEL